jgi:hypothetical protein
MATPKTKSDLPPRHRLLGLKKKGKKPFSLNLSLQVDDSDNDINSPCGNVHSLSDASNTPTPRAMQRGTQQRQQQEQQKVALESPRLHAITTTTTTTTTTWLAEESPMHGKAGGQRSSAKTNHRSLGEVQPPCNRYGRFVPEESPMADSGHSNAARVQRSASMFTFTGVPVKKKIAAKPHKRSVSFGPADSPMHHTPFFSSNRLVMEAESAEKSESKNPSPVKKVKAELSGAGRSVDDAAGTRAHTKLRMRRS